MSRIGLGCMGLSSSYGKVGDEQGLETLQAALDNELIFWDTADVYGHGHNERLLSSVLCARREEVVLASKCGIVGKSSEGLELDGRPRHIYQACEESLKRLKTDYLDLYYLHRVDPDVPIEESVGAIGVLVERGLVRFAGLSEAGSETVKRAHAEFPLAAVQSEYSLFSREVEEAVLPTLRELGIALVAYSPLGRGVLGGRLPSDIELGVDDFRRQLPRFEPENLKKNERLVKKVEAIAKLRGSTTAQVALAWLLHQGDLVIPIPGTKRPTYVAENALACNLTLSPEELGDLDFSDSKIAGARYPEILSRAVGR